MCRAQGEAGCPHGRRCPPNATAREAALKRRRENRAIGQQIARWAKAEGKADELAELKRQRKPINEIKDWAGQAGAPESVFARAAGPAKKGWEAAKTELRNRVQAVLQGLSQSGIKALPLDTEELIELYYDMYNPDTATRQQIKNFDELTADIVTKGEGMAPQAHLQGEDL